DRPEDVGAAWDQAFAARRPILLEMVTDPNVPPLPPDVTLSQTTSYLAALLKGDPAALAVVRSTAKQWWATQFP
ncbi:MAG: thiamine pyrophosphate-requiring protein, partial [Burkholderiales bacterium]|nr:thiamine pyrophosphate-requiring protein [Burkholderiales bacterium]